MNIVIGSGPAGMACAHALLDKGEEVLLVDAGLQLEAEQQALLAEVQGTHSPAAFDKLKDLQTNHKIPGKGLQLKLAHGSDFPYRGVREYLDFEGPETGLLPSLALGGFSNVWGASALPYLQDDIADWPLTTRDLTPHYEAILHRTGLAAEMDDLADLFPFHSGTLTHLAPSSQTRRVLSRLDAIRDKLKAAGIRHGASRLMVGPAPHNPQPCVYCGQCIYGCPYGCIYNSGADLLHLLKTGKPGLTYQPNTIVTSVREKGPTVTVEGFDLHSRVPILLEADRVFIAAGAISSSRIILKSLGVYNQPVDIKDSQYFLFPILLRKSDRAAVTEATHTLSQIFLEIQDSQLSPRTIHLQVYSYNDIISKTLEQKFRLLPGLRRPLVRLLEHRILIVQGYLHSQHSGRISLSLDRAPSSGEETLAVRSIPNPEARTLALKIIRKIGKHLGPLGMFPIASAMEFTLPGRGFHSGGSFPMRTTPGPLEADIHGRVGGHSRIHVVDASTFPSIPATTITLTAMANAHRIGSTSH